VFDIEWIEDPLWLHWIIPEYKWLSVMFRSLVLFYRSSVSRMLMKSSRS